ncbi:MAG: hypothetical protein CMO55_01025 [Verrucomicrobiales bacterium]|nr:hypothetical protein [Verrucomicrobiales bacterium]
MSPLLQHPLVKSLFGLFEHMPELYFFVKDEEGRFHYANVALIERLGLPNREAIVGTTDFDRYPREIATVLLSSDQEALETKSPVVDRLEVLYNQVGILEWFSTTKYPVLTDSGKAVGVVGFTRNVSKQRNLYLQHSAASKVIDFISRNPDCLLTIEDLARKFSISSRQLHRQFKELLGITPQEFVLRSRIHAAAATLRSSDESIASVSEKFGFCDQSAFTKRFQKVIGITPAKYRKNSG